MNGKPSIWWLWIGGFLLATGIGIPGGIFLIALWFYMDYTYKQELRRQNDYYAFGPDQRNLA